MAPFVRLVRLSAAHLDAFAPMTRDPAVLRYTRFPDPPQDDFPRSFLNRYEAGRMVGTRAAFAILDEHDVLLGVALAVDVDRATGYVELGYLIAPEARGRGVATAAVEQLTLWALREGLTRLVLLIDAENAPSRAVAERTGYVLERIDADAELRPGRRGDLAVYAFNNESSGAPHDSRSSGGGTL